VIREAELFVMAEGARRGGRVPDLLARATTADVGPERFGGDLLGADPHAAVTGYAAAACAAVTKVTDGDALVHCHFGDVAARDYLWQLTIARSFLAHEIAMHLGSRGLPVDRGAGPRDVRGHRAEGRVLALGRGVPGADADAV
jgi:hypothetical protein